MAIKKLSEFELAFSDLPDIEDPNEYHTQKKLDDLPKGEYGYTNADVANITTTEDSKTDMNSRTVAILKNSKNIVKSRKRAFLEEPPQKENYKERNVRLEKFFFDEQAEVEDPGIKPPKSKNPIQPTDTDQMTSQTPMQDDSSLGSDQDPNSMGGDPSMDGGMGGGGMGGGVGSSPDYGTKTPRTNEDVGRRYELKKIYDRLVVIDQFLSFNTSKVLMKLRKFVSQSIELFETMINNIQLFKDQVDDILITYYKFIKRVYIILHKYYRLKSEEEDKENNKDNSKVHKEETYIDGNRLKMILEAMKPEHTPMFKEYKQLKNELRVSAGRLSRAKATNSPNYPKFLADYNKTKARFVMKHKDVKNALTGKNVNPQMTKKLKGGIEGHLKSVEDYASKQGNRIAQKAETASSRGVRAKMLLAQRSKSRAVNLTNMKNSNDKEGLLKRREELLVKQREAEAKAVKANKERYAKELEARRAKVTPEELAKRKETLKNKAGRVERGNILNNSKLTEPAQATKTAGEKAAETTGEKAVVAGGEKTAASAGEKIAAAAQDQAGNVERQSGKIKSLGGRILKSTFKSSNKLAKFGSYGAAAAGIGAGGYLAYKKYHKK